jgi:hypothetical protein
MDVLIEGYEDAAPHACCRSGIHAFVAAGLLALAPHPFRVRDPEWPERIATILDRAESLVASNAGLRREHSGRSASVPDSSTTLADRALSLSSEALDLAAMERRVSQLPAFDDSRCSLRLSAVRVTRHKPGRRCLIEYDLTVSRDGCPPRAGTLVAKVRSKGADTRTYGLTQTLWRDGFNSDSADGVSVPEPVGLLADLKMWMQWKAPGTLVAQLLEDTRAVALAERAAVAICKLHNSGASPSRRHGTDDELRILRDRLDAVATETPRWRRRLDALFDASARFANTVPAVTPRGIHRDFHPGQMLVDGERVYLLDLDLYASGDPALDVGNFLAHLAEYSLRTFGDPERLAACEAALTDHFLESTPDISARSIEIYKTLSLARHIYISRLFLERQAFTERILDLCEARLSLVR